MIDAINAVLPGLRGLGRFAKVSEVQVASDGVRASASFPGVPFGKGLVEHLAGRTGGVLSGARFEDRSWGEERITLPLDGISYSVSPRGFFQANWRMNQAMVRRIGAILGDPGFRGSASSGSLRRRRELRASPRGQGSEVVAVEGEARSFRELRRNVRGNALGNVRIVRSSVETFRPEGRFDALVLDPPRAGLSERSLSRVREIAAGTLLRLARTRRPSPATSGPCRIGMSRLARDARLLPEFAPRRGTGRPLGPLILVSPIESVTARCGNRSPLMEVRAKLYIDGRWVRAAGPA